MMKKELAVWLLIFIHCTALSFPSGKSVFASAAEDPKSSGMENGLKRLDNSELQKQETYMRVHDALHVHTFRRVKGSNGGGETVRPKKNGAGESFLLKPSTSAILRNAATVLVACVFFI